MANVPSCLKSQRDFECFLSPQDPRATFVEAPLDLHHWSLPTSSLCKFNVAIEKTIF